jgi:Cu/Ag efflux pump CusA
MPAESSISVMIISMPSPMATGKVLAMMVRFSISIVLVPILTE